MRKINATRYAIGTMKLTEDEKNGDEYQCADEGSKSAPGMKGIIPAEQGCPWRKQADSTNGCTHEPEKRARGRSHKPRRLVRGLVLQVIDCRHCY